LLVQSEVVQAYEQGSGIKDLAKKFHVRSATIRNVLAAAGVPLRSWSDARLRSRISTEDVVRMYSEENLTIRDIATRLHINPKTVILRLTKAGVTRRSISEAKMGRAIARQNPLERFWSYVNMNGPVPAHRPELGACWAWIGSTEEQGYGQFFDGNKLVKAHRFSYELEYGSLPDEKPFACHHCDNRACIRPSHLFAGTNQDNMDDMNAKGRHGTTGKPNWARRLTQEQAREIRALYATGETQTALAKRFGVDQTAVSSIVRNKTYREKPTCAESVSS
jgi:DNA invertase Pin-like site-specific DNA recombinase